MVVLRTLALVAWGHRAVALGSLALGHSWPCSDHGDRHRPAFQEPWIVRDQFLTHAMLKRNTMAVESSACFRLRSPVLQPKGNKRATPVHTVHRRREGQEDWPYSAAICESDPPVARGPTSQAAFGS
jgi:hypothetical protein